MSTAQVLMRADGAPMKRPGLGFSVNVSRDVQPPSSHRAAKSLEHGGAIRGRGTSTSDSVPIWASNGEFMLPADTTAAVGKEKLQALIDATHAPVGRGAVRKSGLQARADGGLIDPLKTPGARGPAAGPAGATSSTVAAAVVATAPDAPSAGFHGVATPAPSTPSSAVLPDAGHPGGGIPSEMTAKPGVASGVLASAVPAVRAPAQPFDAQAAADRGTASGVWGGIKDANNRAGAAIMDAATFVPRGILGAYDTAVVRPMRAAGVDMAYTSPLLTPPGSNLASMTPFYDRFRAGDAAPAAAGAPGGAAASAPPALPAGATTAAAPTAGAVRPVGAAPVVVPTTADTAPAATVVAPSGAVSRTGNSYSGSNVSGDVSINGKQAGGGFMSIPGARFTGGAPGASAVAPAPVAPGAGLTVIGDSGAAGRQVTADFFTDASQRNNLRAAEGSPGGWRAQAGRVAAAQGAIDATANNRAQAAAGALRDAGDTVRAGMREQGDNSRAKMVDARQAVGDQINRERLGLEAKRIVLDSNRDDRAAVAAQADQATKNRKSQLQEMAVNGNSLQRKLAMQNIAAMEGREVTGNQPPSGYRFKGEGTLEYIPGGPADPLARGSRSPLNDTQSKALQFGTRMQVSGEQLDALAVKGFDQPGVLKRAADAVGVGGAANFTQSGEQQQVEQAQRDFVNATLRRESGAAISASEFDNARKQYFPQIGDKPEVIEQKKKNRELTARGILAEVPDSETRVAQVRGAPRPPTAPAVAPQAGQVDDGYTFLGGNPADKRNWEKTQ